MMESTANIALLTTFLGLKIPHFIRYAAIALASAFELFGLNEHLTLRTESGNEPTALHINKRPVIIRQRNGFTLLLPN